MALDDAYFYCRQLEAGNETPSLFKVANAIGTLDLALAYQSDSPMPVSICSEAWSRVRDSLFEILLRSFAGYFVVYSDGGLDAETPINVEPGGEWPESGRLEFFPEESRRKNDSYSGWLSCIGPSVLTPIRWCFAEGRQTITPADFEHDFSVSIDDADESETCPEDTARELLSKLYAVCEEEASEGKKKAHRKWWQLYWEANSCPNKRERHNLQKQMVTLQSIWGRPPK
jgi:hypothetical protein